MSLFRKLDRLDQVAGTALVLLTIAVVALIAYINWAGMSVNLRTTNPRDAASPYETLTLVFSQPVKPADAENAFSLEPAIPGTLTWENDRTAHFVPTKPYLGSVVVRLTRGELGVGGEWLRNDLSWTLITRPIRIVYVNHADPKNELMSIDPDKATPQQLTSTNGKVFDFDVAPSGDTIAYTVINDENSLDIWLVDRDGKNPRILLDCGADRCLVPVWSPDGKFIAYNRQPAGLTPNSPNGAPRPWIVNIETGDDRAVFSDSQAIGYGALWSPDGTWLATFDGIADQIRVVNLKSGQQVSVPNSLGLLGSWSPDSTFLVYTDQTMGMNNILKTYLYRADFKTGEVSILLGKGEDTVDHAYGNPAWSPAGDNIVFSLQPDPEQPDRQLWVIRPDTLGGPIITSESGFSYNSYSWDPWGIGLVIQQVNLKQSFTPEIAMWRPMQGYTVIAAKGIFPRWLP